MIKTNQIIVASSAVAMALTGVVVCEPASAGSLTFWSDGNTLTAVESGTNAGQAPADQALTDFQTGNTSNASSWVNADVGSYGTFTPVPSGAPTGTEVINIDAAVADDLSCCGYDGQSGFFEITFTLPAILTSASISGAGNVDDYGYVFLNGNQIGPTLTEFGNVTFSSSNLSYFQPGSNTFLVADNNTGGPSGAAFFATVTYNVPETSTWAMMLAGFGALAAGGLLRGRKQRLASIG